MKVKVQKECFLKSLQKVSNIIGSRNTLPILANILIEAKEGKIILTTTDLEVRITTSLIAEIIEEGATTLPMKKLLGLVSKLRNGEISIESNEKHHAEIKCGTVVVMLAGLDPQGFPEAAEIPTHSTITVKQNELAGIIDRISYAVSSDDSRKVLQGIYLSAKDDTLVGVATDGKRLAKISRPLTTPIEGDDCSIIVTLKAVNEIKRILEQEGEAKIKVGEKQFIFETNDTRIIAKLIEGTYPNYQQVIPTQFKNSIEVSCEPFIYAIDILNVAISEGNTPNIKLTFANNKLQFEASSTIGEGKESIDVEYNGDELSANFNPNYLLDPFKHLPVEKVFWKINDAVSQIAIESSDGFIYVIMPMRSNSK